MVDPISWSLSIWQIFQGKKIDKQLTEMDVKLDDLTALVLSRLPSNATPAAIVAATATTVLNTPIVALFVAEDGADKTDV